MTEVAEAQKAEIPSSRVIVTSENAGEFYDKQLGITREPEPVVEPEKTAEEKLAKPPETPAEEEEHEEVKKARKNPKIEERMSELAKQRRDAKAEATAADERARAAEERAAAAQRTADELKAKYEPPKTDPLGPEPKPDQFADINEYSLALKDWTKEKVEHDRAQEETARKQREHSEKVAKDWRDRQTAARKELDDYDEKINGSTVSVADHVRDAIIESDVGPQILYHLATNPDVAEKLAKASPVSALREIGRLEAKLSEKPAKEAPKTSIAEISKAPPPITPLRGSGGGDVPRLDNDNVYHGDYKQWKADRAAGRIK